MKKREFSCVIWMMPDYYGTQSFDAFVSSHADYRETGCTPMRGPATPQNRHYDLCVMHNHADECDS